MTLDAILGCWSGLIYGKTIDDRLVTADPSRHPLFCADSEERVEWMRKALTRALPLKRQLTKEETRQHEPFHSNGSNGHRD
jgi:hypothetical protein